MSWPTYYIPLKVREEGIPPPRYYLTTPPYPIEFMESLTSTGSQVSLGFIPSAELEEYFTSFGSPIGGTLTELLKSVSVLPEDLTSTGLPIGGVLANVLKSYTVPEELIVSAGLPIGGVLEDPLVRYQNWPLGVDQEDLVSTGSPVSGVLA